MHDLPIVNPVLLVGALSRGRGRQISKQPANFVTEKQTEAQGLRDARIESSHGA